MSIKRYLLKIVFNCLWLFNTYFWRILIYSFISVKHAFSQGTCSYILLMFQVMMFQTLS